MKHDTVHHTGVKRELEVWITTHGLEPTQLSERHKAEFIKYIKPRLAKESGDRNPVKLQRNVDELFEKASNGKLHIENEQPDNIRYYKVSQAKGHQVTSAGTDWIKQHISVTNSISNEVDLDFVSTVNNRCTLWRAIASKPSPRLIRWVLNHQGWKGINGKVLLDALHYTKVPTFDESKVLIDSPTKIYIHYSNGTVTIDRRGWKFGTTPPGLVWAKNVRTRPFKYVKRRSIVEKIAINAVVPKRLDAYKKSIGYLIHRRWGKRFPMAPWACDYKPKTKADGRRGKDFLFSIVQYIRNTSVVKVPREEGAQRFMYSDITKETENIHYEDVPGWYDDRMKDQVTSNFVAEGKGTNKITIDFLYKPKESLSSQVYPSKITDLSHSERFPVIELTEYYQTRPLDASRKDDIFDGNDFDWNAFDSFIVNCCVLWLKHLRKIDNKGLDEASFLRQRYGSDFVDACASVKEALKKSEDGFISTKSLTGWLGISKKDHKQTARFLECYAEVNKGEHLRHHRKAGGGDRGFIRELPKT